jgi:hypothetical protein
VIKCELPNLKHCSIMYLCFRGLGNIGQEEAEKTRHLFQRLAVLLAKGNAALFLNRVPCHPSAVIDGSH